MCNESFAQYNLIDITKTLHSFWINDFCDLYLEYSKLVLQHGPAQRVSAVRNVLLCCLDTGLRLLSPLMPYLSEELYQRLPIHNKAPSVCVAPFPSSLQYNFYDATLEQDLSVIKEISSQLLALRRDLALTKAKANVYLQTNDADIRRAVSDHNLALVTASRSASFTLVNQGQGEPLTNGVSLGQGESLTLVTQGQDGQSFKSSVPPYVDCLKISAVDDTWSLFVQLRCLIDTQQEIDRLDKQRVKLNDELNLLTRRLQSDCLPQEKLLYQEKLKSAVASLKRISGVQDSLIELNERH